MSAVPIIRICPKCKRIYSVNPSLGQLYCPNCGPILIKSIVEEIFKKRK